MGIVLIALPLVRYEGLAISLPVCGYLLWRGERGVAGIVLMSTAVLVGGFSLFLHHVGLG